MALPLSVSMLRTKRNQIRDTIAAYEAKLREAQADLAHVLATLRLILVADADESFLQQSDDRGHHPLAGQSRALQIGFQLFAQRRQCSGEFRQMRIFGAVTDCDEVGMVAILLASFGIAAGGLQVSIGARRDPNPGPDRWNGQLARSATRSCWRRAPPPPCTSR